MRSYFIILWALNSASAFASLGEYALFAPATDPEAGTDAPYTVQTSVQHGTTIREYVLPNHQVFAVTWRGISQPDLAQLLGSYYSVMTPAPHDRRQGHRPQTSIGRGVVVERFGHMRDVRGKAYLPGLIPSGVSVSELN